MACVPSSHAGTSAFRRDLPPWLGPYSRAMTAEGIALILGALGALLTAVSTAFVLMWKQIKTVHVIVNQNRTDMLQYQSDLISVLQSNGIIVPRDQSTHARTESLSKPDGLDRA